MAAATDVEATLPSTQTQTALYVGDLREDVTGALLREIFNRVAPKVQYVKVYRDSKKTSLGYARVQYSTPKEASDAMRLLNSTVINGQPMRIMYWDPDPALGKSGGTANILIKNLNPSVDTDVLDFVFSSYGSTLSCRVATDAAGNSKGFGFVQFEHEEAAANAIHRANGMILHKRRAVVHPFMIKEKKSSASKCKNIFVKNLSKETTDEDLYAIFETFGAITSAEVIRNANGKSKRFGFVTLENADDAAKAIESLNGIKIDNKEWYVGTAQKESEKEIKLRERYEQLQKERLNYQDANLWVDNIDDMAINNDDMLRDLFTAFGTVTMCRIIRSPGGRSTGAGFVRFSLPEEAEKAVSEMNNKAVGRKMLTVAMAHQTQEEIQEATPSLSAGPESDSLMNAPDRVAAGYPMHNYGQNHHGLIFPEQPNRYRYHQPDPYGLNYSMQPNVFSYPQPYYVLNQLMQPAAHLYRPGLVEGQRIQRRQAGAPVQRHEAQAFLQQHFPAIRGASLGAAGSLFNMPVPALNYPTSASASTRQHQQQTLGEQLYLLVDQLEHYHAGRVTDMLLRLERTEVLRLIESPEALRVRVAEAMDVLRADDQSSTAPRGY